MTRLYHQLGFRYNWNFESSRDDQTGDGFILAPRYMTSSHTHGLPPEVREQSIFDPQFFLPASDMGKLGTYDFFPNQIADGFDTTEWTAGHAQETATSCLEFQVNCGFQHLVIPTRYMPGVPDNFIADQEQFSVNAFREVLATIDTNVPCLLQLILTEHMLKTETFRTDVLNWVTGMQDLSGVYLIYHIDRRRKQITDFDFLLSVMLFIKTLKDAGMFVLVGYVNTEAIPLLVTQPDIITMGSYENLRMFGLDAFAPADGQRRGPNARLYVPCLLQWIDYEYRGPIAMAVSGQTEFFQETEYRLAMFQPSYQWHFARPEPYKHYFVVFDEQVHRLLHEGEASSIYSAVRNECQQAWEYYQQLSNAGVLLEPDSAGGHLPIWLNVLNRYHQMYGD